MNRNVLDGEERRGTDRRLARDDSVANELAEALTRGEIEVLFQPQFASQGGLVGAEALANWHHRELGRLSGDRLFAMAGAAGEAVPLARQLAREALASAAQWAAPLRLSLNVTAADLAADDFVEAMGALIAESGFPAERLTLEITEEALLDDLPRCAERLQAMAERGVHIALDDFGAGFCNFDYLKRLPLHGLKLDRSMIEGIETPGRDLAVLRGVLAMAGALDLEVTAEGIERQGQLDTIVREGCAYWQGFLGAEPLSGAAFVALAGAKPPAAPLS